ncbi:BREX system P-loop protein BrxC [Gimesia maris]|uniref:BREX system P-loop protein BrxC n=1 Tax=Gimesia maris TaxID=122 RepID=UPI003A8CDD59
MKISDLFKKNIARPINGVVKADQLDTESVWQELDEFVVTKELDGHLRKFFERYCEAIDSPNDPDISGKIGVWVSGFFGSGKSHFIKVLSHLLANNTHTHNGHAQNAVDFFDDKITDATILGDIKRAVVSDTDVILFNIDSKASSSTGRDAILAVFLKVLNEKLGYSPDHAHIAHMERYLDEKGKYDEFQDVYRQLTSTQWKDERDAYEFNRDEVIEALSKTLGQSQETCEKWVDSGESNFSLTIENFAKWTKQYLDTQGPNHRIIFLVDEVGQFIGSDTALMLNLQTITEQLGTVCNGRAWVVVTSQEDIDAVLGEMRATKEMDFSKIQGRFITRLSLSSNNVDEVIKERLLRKHDSVAPDLVKLYQEKGDILKNQLSFREVGTTYKTFKEADDFVHTYPFAPYQFKLLQRIFESIRKAGATGLHLAQGERSLLDAFQHAAKTVSDQEVGVLVPVYLFYPSIESFLDTTVKRTIDHAKENESLEPFDIHVLQVLFLIRYVDEMKGNVDNLVTLCLDEIDADRLGLKKKIEESLARLEKDSLVSRSGDLYYFLTNEERDINQEIKKEVISGADEAKLLGDIIFLDVLKDQKKHRYSATKKDIPFNRICDQHPIGRNTDGAMTYSVISPLDDDFGQCSDQKCILSSSGDEGKAIVRLDDKEALGRELKSYLRTDKYIRTKDDSTSPPTTRRIHKDLAAENQQRRNLLANLLSEMLVDASYFVAGEKLEISSSGPITAMEEALEYLVENTFTKLSYLKYLNENPFKEIQAILKSDDTAQQALQMDLPENNPQALEEVRRYVDLASGRDKEIVMYDICFGRFSDRPYGWPEPEAALLLVRLYAAGEILFMRGGDAIKHDDLYAALSETKNWRKITVVQKVTAKIEDVKKARELGKEVFHEMGPETEDSLYDFLRKELTHQQSNLKRYADVAQDGRYPGKQSITESLATIKELLRADDSKRFLERFNECESELLQLSDDFHDLQHFFESQKPTWDKMLKAEQQFSLNQRQLEQDEDAKKALDRIKVIRTAAEPYGMVHEVDPLVASIQKVNDKLVTEQRTKSLEVIEAQIAAIRQELKAVGGDPIISSSCLKPLESLKNQVGGQTSLAHITQAETDAVNLKDKAISKIGQFIARQEATKPSSVAEKGENKTSDTPKPKFKQPRVIHPKTLTTKTYLESQADIDDFLTTLRTQLESAINNDERIEIR